MRCFWPLVFSKPRVQVGDGDEAAKPGYRPAKLFVFPDVGSAAWGKSWFTRVWLPGSMWGFGFEMGCRSPTMNSTTPAGRPDEPSEARHLTAAERTRIDESPISAKQGDAMCERETTNTKAMAPIPHPLNPGEIGFWCGGPWPVPLPLRPVPADHSAMLKAPAGTPRPSRLAPLTKPREALVEPAWGEITGRR